MSQPTGPANQAEVNAFLAAYPEIIVGRDALNKAEKDTGHGTLSIVNKPLANVVLVQHFNPDTLKQLCAVALVSGQKTEDYYMEENQGEGDEEENFKGCPDCGAGSSRLAMEVPSRFVFERMEICTDTCLKAETGCMWPA